MSIYVKGWHTQRGDMLLEALIGVLITGLIAGGMAHLTARLQASQWEARVQSLLVEGVRNQLQTEGVGLCANQSLELPDVLILETAAPSFSCDTAADLTLSLNGQNISVSPPQAVQITIPSADLGVPGPDLIMGTQQ